MCTVPETLCSCVHFALPFGEFTRFYLVFRRKDNELQSEQSLTGYVSKVVWEGSKMRSLYMKNTLTGKICHVNVNVNYTEQNRILCKQNIHCMQLYHYKPGQALWVPGGWRYQNFYTTGTCRCWVCQPYAPAAFTSQEILLVVISVRGSVDSGADTLHWATCPCALSKKGASLCW